jgi:hypothetical protein
MPSADDLIKKVIKGNSVKVEVDISPEIEQKFNEMEERQTEQHEETLQAQKKVNDKLVKSATSGSSNFKEGGDLINKGFKGLTGIDVGGKFGDLKEKVGDLGNIFKGVGRLIGIQIGGEAAAAGAQVQGNRIAEQQRLSQAESAGYLKDISESQRKAEVATRIQSEQEELLKNTLTPEVLAQSTTAIDPDTGERVEVTLGEAIQSFTDRANRGEFLDDDLKQDKTLRGNAIIDILETFNLLDNNAPGVEELNTELETFLRNTSRLAYELRSQDIAPNLDLDIGSDTFGAINLDTVTGRVEKNFNNILKTIESELGENVSLKDLDEQELLDVLTSTESDFSPFDRESIIKEFGSATDMIKLIEDNTRDVIEDLRNTLEGEYRQNIVERNKLKKELEGEDTSVGSTATMIADENTSMWTDYLSNLPLIYGAVSGSYQLEKENNMQEESLEDARMLFNQGKKDKDGPQIEDKAGNKLMDMMGGEGGGKGGSFNPLDTLVGALSAKVGMDSVGKLKGQQKPPKPGATAGKTAARGAGGVAAGFGIRALLMNPYVLAAAAVIGTVGVLGGILPGLERNEDDERGGDESTDYEKERTLERKEAVKRVQGEDDYVKGESLVDVNTFRDSTTLGDTLFGWARASKIDWENEGFASMEDDPRARLQQLMDIDKVAGDDLSKEDRQRLDEELKMAQEAMSASLSKQLSETQNEFFTLEDGQDILDYTIKCLNQLTEVMKEKEANQMMSVDASNVTNTTVINRSARDEDSDASRAMVGT